MEWNDRTAVKKGNFAEDIIQQYLEKLNYVVYKPVTNRKHCFDNLAIKEKKRAIIFEVKAKAKRNYYDDTGINITHFNEYSFISEKHSLPVFIFFVDEMLKEIYGNFLSELIKDVSIKNKKYPSFEKNIVYFPLMNMRRKIIDLDEEQTKLLIGYSTRNYGYGNKT